MKEDIQEIKIMLAKIETDIRHHIKRTDLLETDVRMWRKDIEPIQKHVGFVNGLAKLSIVAAACATVVGVLVAIFK